jgi:hypothetical protein
MAKTLRQEEPLLVAMRPHEIIEVAEFTRNPLAKALRIQTQDV